MFAARRLNTARPLILAATTAAFVLGVSVVAEAAAPAPTATKSASTITERHAKGGAAEEQNERNEHLQKMTQRLKLTDDQAAKMKSILQAQWAESSELRAKYKGQPATPESKAAMREARKDLHARTDAQLAQVLTAGQMTEFRKLRAAHKREREKEEPGEAKEGTE